MLNGYYEISSDQAFKTELGFSFMDYMLEIKMLHLMDYMMEIKILHLMDMYRTISKFFPMRQIIIMHFCTLFLYFS